MRDKTERPLWDFRVFAEFDKTYNVYVAYCLETGTTATADDLQNLRRIMIDVLRDEVAFALTNKNLNNLYSTPAPLEIWLKWDEAAKSGKQIETIPLELPEVRFGGNTSGRNAATATIATAA
jgi:hypothetical protein